MSNKTIPYFIVLLFLYCCKLDKKHNTKTTEISKICIASGGCYGKCPKLAIEIDSTLSYRFYGGGFSEIKGIYKGKIEKSYWQNICQSLDEIEYEKSDSFYLHSVDDLSIETIIYYSGKKKHIYAQELSLPDSVSKVFIKIINSYKKVKLTKESNNDFDMFKFETKYQNGIPPIPILPTK
jgi:hypothetical protein